MRTLVLAALSAVSLAFIAACGGSPGPAYFVYAGGSGQSRAVLLIQWSAPQGSQVQGTLTYDGIDLSNSPQESLSVKSVPFTGTINGNSVTLTLSSLLSNTTITAALGNGTLTLTTPPDSSTGAIQSATLTSATVTTYNSDVTALRAAIHQADTLAAEQQAAQQQQQQDAQALTAAQSDLATLKQDSGPNGSLPGDLQTLAGDVKTIQGDITTVQQDLAQPGSSYCSNQVSAAGDASSADGDTASLGGDVSSLTSDIQTIQQDITTLQTDLTTLTSDGVSPPTGASAAISAAQAAITNAKAIANSYIKQGNAADQQAFATANAAATGPCSGDGPGQPSSLVQPLH